MVETTVEGTAGAGSSRLDCLGLQQGMHRATGRHSNDSFTGPSRLATECTSVLQWGAQEAGGHSLSQQVESCGLQQPP